MFSEGTPTRGLCSPRPLTLNLRTFTLLKLDDQLFSYPNYEKLVVNAFWILVEGHTERRTA